MVLKFILAMENKRRRKMGLNFAKIRCIDFDSDEGLRYYQARINPLAVLSMEYNGDITRIHTITRIYETEVDPDILERIFRDVHRRNSYIKFKN